MVKSFTQELIVASRPAAFSYDHEHGLFHHGSRASRPAELPLGWGDLSDRGTSDNVPDVALVHGVNYPIMLPKMYDRLSSNGTQELLDETCEVMFDVFDTLGTGLSIGSKNEGSYGHTGFGAGFLSDEHPHPTLQVFGNCACLSVDMYGAFREDRWEEKVAEFTYHNIDLDAQRISLLAGLGHLAHRASN